jgi:hypothetical protein
MVNGHEDNSEKTEAVKKQFLKGKELITKLAKMSEKKDKKEPIYSRENIL